MDKIQLRKLNRTDMPLFFKWWNDGELRKWTSDTYDKMSEEETNKIILEHLKNKNYYDFIIEFGSKPVGHILIQKDKQNYYKYYIAIGEKDYWNKGIGTKATELACDWFFANFPSSVLKLEVNQDNTRAICCYKNSGFKNAGKMHYKGKKPTFVMIKEKI